MSNTNSTARVDIGLLDTPLPDGKAFAQINLVLTDASGHTVPQAIDGVTQTSYTFQVANLAPGPFTVTATAVATDGTALASASGGGVLVAQVVPPGTFPAPTSITITLA